MANTTVERREEPLFPVGSRVSWGAILAGAVVAVAIFYLLSLLGVAIGLSVADRGAMNEIGMGAAIWAVVVLLFALFAGGWVASQCTIGESRMEAAMYGVIVWGAFFAILLWFVGGGISMGFNTIMAATDAAPQQAQQVVQGGQQVAIDPIRAQEVGMRTAWWAFFGTLLSMGAAIGGALVGAAGVEHNVVRYRAFFSNRSGQVTPTT